jgi:hypothetical protein
MDFGSSPSFGDAAVVFKNSHVRDMVVIAGVDTGLWEMTCNKSSDSNESWGFDLNCSAWQPPIVGTMDYFDHLILSNLNSWKGKATTAVEAARLFARMAFGGDYLKLPNLESADKEKYWEANILGNPSLAKGVSLIIGDFAHLFGTDKGRALQQLAEQRGWPLAWARGLLSESSHSSSDVPFAGNGRVLDPSVSSSKDLNASFPVEAQQDFADLWSTVEKSRSAATPSAEQWQGWWSTLSSNQGPLAPVTAFACSARNSCIGLNAGNGDCVCHSGGSTVIV